MKTVRVQKVSLTEQVRANRKQHHTIFLEAVEGYRRQAVQLLEGHIARIKSGKVQQVYVSLPYPVDHTRDYDRVLAMLDMEIGDTVELSEQEFAQYVMDDWAWKREFLATNSAYSVTAATTLREGEEGDA